MGKENSFFIFIKYFRRYWLFRHNCEVSAGVQSLCAPNVSTGGVVNDQNHAPLALTLKNKPTSNNVPLLTWGCDERKCSLPYLLFNTGGQTQRITSRREIIWLI